jgi:simple sugar transport system ATP-binding protein
MAERSGTSAATPAPAGGGAPLLALRGIVKSFPGCLANDRVDLDVVAGEIHALLGENGAGKSTLVKIIYGVLRADAGETLWRGKPVRIASPHAARRLGIGMVFQHFSLFESLTVAENIALGIDDPAGRRDLRRRIVEVSGSYGLALDPDRHVYDLSVGERQRIEIVRCLLQDPKLLIMDEPTSVLTPQEVERLFGTLRRIAGEGCAILYISHKLEEIRALCQRATIMRLGRVVATCDPRRETARRLAELMLGDELKQPARGARTAAAATPRLVVDRLSLPSEQRFGTALKEISFSVAPGEILGIGGIAGNGQNELMAALSGESLAPSAGAIRIDGTPAGRMGPAARTSLGAGFVPEQRDGHAAVRDMSLADNALLRGWRRMGLVEHGVIRGGRAAAFAAEVIRGFDVRTTGPRAQARSLSGGNLQKFVVGREILQTPGLLVVSQPTWGVDAGASATIHGALLDLAAAGAAIVVISQDLDEIFAICDRIAVIAAGRLSEAQPVGAVTIEQIGLLMGGTAATAGEAHAASA